MSMTLYYLALVIHVIGITVMAGTTFIDFVTFRAFCRFYQTDKNKGLVLENYLYGLQRFLGIGMLLILLSGITMMAKLHEVWGAQLWFRIKMGILLLIIINGLGLRRMLGSRLRKLVAGNENWQGLATKFTLVQVVQMLLFVVIYVLSVYKFN
jgi:hypothetical protein